MAKVKGPLFSLSAHGKIADTLVYMDWKGIDTVRQYVIPANPKTAGQQTQRGYFGNAISAWHVDGYTALDVAAFNLYALAQKIAASGFNMFVRLYVNAKVAAKTWDALVDITIGTPAANTCVITVATASDLTLKCYYGVSKTSMLNVQDGVFETGTTTFSLSGLSASTKYYFYIKTESAGGAERTGIYSFTTPAA